MHLRECVTLKKQLLDAGELVDVEWAADVQVVFETGIRLLVADRRGLLADVAPCVDGASLGLWASVPHSCGVSLRLTSCAA